MPFARASQTRLMTPNRPAKGARPAGRVGGLAVPMRRPDRAKARGLQHGAARTDPSLGAPAVPRIMAVNLGPEPFPATRCGKGTSLAPAIVETEQHVR
jgi:hypothetical protein